MQTTPIIRVENLIAQYGDTVVLQDISATVMSHEIRVVLGTSGCGKTTLLKSIIGLLKPTSGTVSLFGHPVHDIDDPDTAQRLKMVGVLFQNGALLGSLTIAQNVALPLQMHSTLPKSIINDIVRQKLFQVGLPGVYELYPRELSGGMRKRAALARALVLDPPLLFCDEPSAGLDPVTAAGIDELLLKIRESFGITILVITHEILSIKKIADTIIFLHEGRILFDGTLADALTISSGPLYDFFNRIERRFSTEHLQQHLLKVEK
jgi:phospholipid/cholesterol/gamma-HCH transport system ATP-binding protein